MAIASHIARTAVGRWPDDPGTGERLGSALDARVAIDDGLVGQDDAARPPGRCCSRPSAGRGRSTGCRSTDGNGPMLRMRNDRWPRSRRWSAAARAPASSSTVRLGMPGRGRGVDGHDREAGALDVVDLRSVRARARWRATPATFAAVDGEADRPVERGDELDGETGSLGGGQRPGGELAEVRVRKHRARAPAGRGWRSCPWRRWPRVAAAALRSVAEGRRAVTDPRQRLGPETVGRVERERHGRLRDARGRGNICDRRPACLLRQPCLQRPTDRSAAMARVGEDPARVCKLGRRI